MSKQRNFRPRAKLNHDEEEDAGAPITIKPTQPPAPSAAAAPKPAAAKKPSMLSFDEDGEGEDAGRPVVASKKKDKDRGKSKFRGAVPLPEIPVVTSSSQRTGAGEYTTDKLQALKQETFAFSAKGSSSAKQESTPSEPGIKLSGSFKPAGLPRDDRYSINPIALVSAAKSEGTAAARLPGAKAEGQEGRPTGGASMAVAQGASDEEDDDDGQAIPDERMIKIAKAKRERLRQAHLAPDYVPLGGASKLLSGSAHQSTQGQEADAGPSDSDAEADLEDGMRMKFSAGGEQAKRQDPKLYARSINVNDEDDSFASEQLRNAVRRQHASMAAASARAASPVMHGGGLMGAGHAAAGPVARSRIQQISGLGANVMSALQEGVARLQASHHSSQSNLLRTDANLTACFSKVEELEAGIKSASDKYVYVQECFSAAGEEGLKPSHKPDSRPDA